VVTAISYLPFGPIASYTLGNGQTITRIYDANYALTDVVSPALNLHFARDAMGNITALGNTPGANPAVEDYSYDPLYRLTGLSDGNGSVEEAYTYSKAGDRLSKTASGLATGVYTYQTGTHHLASIGNASRAYDANGNTTGSIVGGDTFGFGYNGRNRMTVVQRDGSTVGTYTYNALGQRTAKAVTFPAASNQRFAYDEASQLQGEYGASSRDYIWLGNLPVAVVDTAAGASSVTYVHADGLGTPRAVTDATGSSVWQLAYHGNAFGEQPPSSSGTFIYNLRYSGQYYDAESGLNYNVNRDYEPGTGRYIQSDPLGLVASPNTYAYAGARPLTSIDPFGLFLTTVDATCSQDPKFCAEIFGDISRAEGSIQAKLGDKCAEVRGNAAADLFDSLGNMAMVAPVLGGAAERAAGRLPRYEGPKPTYDVNPAHVPGQRGFNPSKTPLPGDAADVYGSAVPNDPVNPTAWFGRNGDGQTYRYSPSNDGNAHFSGIDGIGDGVRNLTQYAIDRLNGH
jgi:RHS repeat-associated protein